jgi:DNA polymerase (family 10)
MIDNFQIADQFSLLSRLMDIHGENSFKSKSYAIAAFNIEKLPVQLSELPADKIPGLKGIGDSTGKKILEIIQTGKLAALEDLMGKTPQGVFEMLSIKGLGPKKINTVWKEMQVETLGELLYACQENRLLLYKGFGAKTQQNVMDAIEFYFRNRGSFLYAEIEKYALGIHGELLKAFSGQLLALTGSFRRQNEIINELEWISAVPESSVSEFLKTHNIEKTGVADSKHQYRGTENVPLEFIFTSTENFYRQLFNTSCSPGFLEEWQNKYPDTVAASEEEIFSRQHINYIPAFLRENPEIIEKAFAAPLPDVIQTADIKGIIHSHSNWSDGVNTIEEMAKACIEKGFEYLVISDHSKSAFYANGLQEDRIREQHKLIDELNNRFRPFRIFKSIESDILNDGSLDYPDQILSTFDLVIASVHANLKMTEEKAMARLLKAIENPHTTILGHMTGRLLLSRQGYPVNTSTIIDACKEHHVVIELNAHPRRLDLDWHFIPEAIGKGVTISIDPDAHSIEGYNDVRYGVLAAQKGALTRENNLSSYSLSQFEQFISMKKH